MANLPWDGASAPGSLRCYLRPSNDRPRRVGGGLRRGRRRDELELLDHVGSTFGGPLLEVLDRETRDDGPDRGPPQGIDRIGVADPARAQHEIDTIYARGFQERAHVSDLIGSRESQKLLPWRHEIGRASCRGRGENSGGAVSF